MIWDIQGDCILFATENGMGKRTLTDEFSDQHRGGKGVLCYRITEKTGNLVAAKAVNEGDQIMMITSEGVMIRTPVDSVSVIGRNTQGVKLINLSSADARVVGVARLARDMVPEEDDGESGDGSGPDAADETEE